MTPKVGYVFWSPDFNGMEMKLHAQWGLWKEWDRRTRDAQERHKRARQASMPNNFGRPGKR